MASTFGATATHFYVPMLRSRKSKRFSRKPEPLPNLFEERLTIGIDVARPTGIEPVLRVPETLVISFSLRARAKFFITGSSISQRALWQLGWPRGPFRRE